MSGLIVLRAAWAPRLLSVLRIVVALLFLQHGLAKYFGFPHVAAMDAFVALPFAQKITMLPGISGLIELIGSLLLLVGLFSVPAAFIMSGEMAAAYFLANNPRGFFPLLNGGEAAILFCFVFLYIAAAGPGPWSLDAKRT